MGVALCAQQQPEVSRADHKPNPVGVWRLILPVCSISMTTTIGRPGACAIMQCRVAGGPGAQPPAAPRVHGGDEAHLIVATGRVGLAWCHHEACRQVVERLFGGGSGSGVVEFHRLEGAVDVATERKLGGGGLAHYGRCRRRRWPWRKRGRWRRCRRRARWRRRRGRWRRRARGRRRVGRSNARCAQQ